MNTCNGSCSVTLKHVGFQQTCNDSLVPYDLPLNNHSSLEGGSNTILSVDISWNASHANQVKVSTLYKPDSACSGNYQVRNCTLDMAVVSNPVSVYFNTSNDWAWSYYLYQDTGSTAHRNLTGNEYIPSPVEHLLPDLDNSTTTVFGGIAEALKSYYDSSITLSATKNGTSLDINGVWAQQIQPASSGWNDDGTPVVLANQCNQNFSQFELYNNPSDAILDDIRTTLFYTSIYASDYSDGVATAQNSQTLPVVLDEITVNEYQVLWRYWGGSVAITMAIVLFILPTFYGFWTLARRTTLSPFETARAFHAPILHDAPRDLDTKMLLKQVGGKNVHTDMVHGGANPVLLKPVPKGPSGLDMV